MPNHSRNNRNHDRKWIEKIGLAYKRRLSVKLQQALQAASLDDVKKVTEAGADLNASFDNGLIHYSLPLMRSRVVTRRYQAIRARFQVT